MFARSASTTRRARTPLTLLVIGLSLVLAAAFGPPAATADDPGHSGDAPYRGKVISLLRHMTLGAEGRASSSSSRWPVATPTR